MSWAWEMRGGFPFLLISGFWRLCGKILIKQPPSSYGDTGCPLLPCGKSSVGFSSPSGFTKNQFLLSTIGMDPPHFGSFAGKFLTELLIKRPRDTPQPSRLTRRNQFS